MGGSNLAVRAGSPGAEAKLVELAADSDGPNYAVGQIEDLRQLTSGWTDELGQLLERCWPGPDEVAHAFSADDVAVVVEGALPASFIEGTMLMMDR